MDEVRGFDLLLMVAFHGFYTAGYLFGFRPAAWLFNFFNPVEPFFAGLFILICGISCRLSHSNWKRGGLLLAVAAVMSAFLFVFMRKEMIWFGILHFLAVSILLFALCRPLLDKIPPAWGVAACAVLTLITWWVPGYRGSPVRHSGAAVLPHTGERAGLRVAVSRGWAWARGPIISRCCPGCSCSWRAASWGGGPRRDGSPGSCMSAGRGGWPGWGGTRW